MNHVVADGERRANDMEVAAEPWPECTPELCEAINAARFFAIVAEPEVAAVGCALVDRVCRELAASALSAHDARELPTGDSRHADGLCAGSTTKDKHKAADTKLHPHELTTLPRVCFTSAHNRRMAQYCLAIHGRVPFLAFADTCDEEDEHSFVLDLHARHTTEEANKKKNKERKANTEGDQVTYDMETDVRAFLIRLLHGQEPRAMQGAAPPPGDLFLPTHGVVLCEGRSAVTSSYERLKRASSSCNSLASSVLGAPGGCLCVYWSDRCACCPGVLAEVELVVCLIRRVADVVLGRRNKKHLITSTHTTLTTTTNDELFQFVACNIDDNDFRTQDWASGTSKPTVPSITAFPAQSQYYSNNNNTSTDESNNNCDETHIHGVNFTGERTALALVQFICTYCLPSASEAPPMKEIAAHAARIAVTRLGDVDLLMRTLDAKTNMTYQRAQERLAELMTQQRESELAIEQAALEEIMRLFRQARRPLLDVEAIVQEECKAMAASNTNSTTAYTNGVAGEQSKHTNGVHVDESATVKRARTECNLTKSTENEALYDGEGEEDDKTNVASVAHRGRAAAAQLSVNTTHATALLGKPHEKRARDANY